MRIDSNQEAYETPKNWQQNTYFCATMMQRTSPRSRYNMNRRLEIFAKPFFPDTYTLTLYADQWRVSWMMILWQSTRTEWRNASEESRFMMSLRFLWCEDAGRGWRALRRRAGFIFMCNDDFLWRARYIARIRQTGYVSKLSSLLKNKLGYN